MIADSRLSSQELLFGHPHRLLSRFQKVTWEHLTSRFSRVVRFTWGGMYSQRLLLHFSIGCLVFFRCSCQPASSIRNYLCFACKDWLPSAKIRGSWGRVFTCDSQLAYSQPQTWRERLQLLQSLSIHNPSNMHTSSKWKVFSLRWKQFSGCWLMCSSSGKW